MTVAGEPAVEDRSARGSQLPKGNALSLRDRVLGLRDRILSDAGFQRYAGTFLFTRPIARRRAAALFDLCAGFVYSQILLACVRVDLFDRLAEGPISASDLAPRLGLATEAAATLLDAAVALKLAQKRSRGRYGLGPLGAALRGNPGVVEMIAHHAMLYDDLRDPVALLKGDGISGELSRYWTYARAAQPAAAKVVDVAPYTKLMAASQPMIARQVLSAYDFSAHRCLLDVGGGDGSFIVAVLAAHSSLHATLFDLPSVAEIARDRFRQANLQDQASAIGGSFRLDSLPRGADIVTLVRVLHDHDDDVVLQLLRAVYRALPSGGTLLIAEPLAETPGAEAIGNAYFAFYLRAMGSGKPRSFARIAELLGHVGFRDIAWKRTATPILSSVIVAKVVNQT